MEDKQVIVVHLKFLLKATRAGSKIADLILNEEQDKVTILFRTGAIKTVNVEADSGIALIKDVVAALY